VPPCALPFPLKTSARSAGIVSSAVDDLDFTTGRSRAGTSKSAIPRWPTASSTRLVHNAQRIEMRGDSAQESWETERIESISSSVAALATTPSERK
jgi:hypothetical protein